MAWIVPPQPRSTSTQATLARGQHALDVAHDPRAQLGAVGHHPRAQVGAARDPVEQLFGQPRLAEASVAPAGEAGHLGGLEAERVAQLGDRRHSDAHEQRHELVAVGLEDRGAGAKLAR